MSDPCRACVESPAVELPVYGPLGQRDSGIGWRVCVPHAHYFARYVMHGPWRWITTTLTGRAP